MRYEMAATSCESKRSSTYSEDLRWHMVYQREGMGLSYTEVAKNLNVDQSMVKRVVKLFNDTGNVTKKKLMTNPICLERSPRWSSFASFNCDSVFWNKIERDQI